MQIEKKTLEKAKTKIEFEKKHETLPKRWSKEKSEMREIHDNESSRLIW